MSNICKCPYPPGGTITCAPDQIAICSYKNGQIESGCINVIRTNKRLSVLNFTISVITGRRRSSNHAVTANEIRILKSGKYGTSFVKVTFKLPSKIENLINQIDIKREGQSDNRELDIE